METNCLFDYLTLILRRNKNFRVEISLFIAFILRWICLAAAKYWRGREIFYWLWFSFVVETQKLNLYLKLVWNFFFRWFEVLLCFYWPKIYCKLRKLIIWLGWQILRLRLRGLGFQLVRSLFNLHDTWFELMLCFWLFGYLQNAKNEKNSVIYLELWRSLH